MIMIEKNWTEAEDHITHVRCSQTTDYQVPKYLTFILRSLLIQSHFCQLTCCLGESVEELEEIV